MLFRSERQKKWAEETGGKKTGYFELAIYPKYNREHWLYVEIKETALLKDLVIKQTLAGHLKTMAIRLSTT